MHDKVSDLVSLDAPDSATYLGASPTEPQQCVTQAEDNGTTAYGAEGVALLADDASQAMSGQTIQYDRFFSYAGDGVDVTSAYGAGHLTGVEVGWNRFDLGGFTAAGAVNVDADNGDTVSGVTIEHNRGTVAAPSATITEDDNGGPPSGGTISDVTTDHNRIR